MYMAKVLATDLDGTFFYPKKRITMISKKYVKLVRKWIDDGNLLVLITGRNIYGAKRAAKIIDRNLTIICCNSAFIYENGTKVFYEAIKPEILKNVINVLDEKFKCLTYITFGEKHNMALYVKRVRFFTKLFYPFWSISELMYFEPYVISKKAFWKSIDEDNVYKLMIVLGLGKKSKAYSSVARTYIHNHFKDIEVAFSAGMIEITAKGRNKASGLLQYIENKGFKREDVIVVGDSGNDIDLFKEFHENSFCMEHSLQKVKKHAKYVINRFSDLENYLYSDKKEEK